MVDKSSTEKEYLDLLRAELEQPPMDRKAASLVLLGQTGVGKSHLLNAAFGSILLERGLPISLVGATTRVTRRITPYDLYPSLDLIVYDTPGYELSGVKGGLDLYEERMKTFLSALAERGELVVWYLVRSGTNFESFDLDLLSVAREVGAISIVTLTHFYKSRQEYEMLSTLEDHALPCKAILPILASDAEIGPGGQWLLERHGLAELLFLTGNTYRGASTRQGLVRLATSLLETP